MFVSGYLGCQFRLREVLYPWVFPSVAPYPFHPRVRITHSRVGRLYAALVMYKVHMCSNQFSSKYPIDCQDSRSALAWSLLFNNSKVKTEVVHVTNIKSCKQLAVGASPAMAVHQIRPHPAIMHSLSTRLRVRLL